MKKFVLISIMLIGATTSLLFAQTNFEITVIDSFKWNSSIGGGVEAADAAEFNGSIFLSYFYSSNASNKRYVFLVKKENGIYSIDTVATFIQDYFSHTRATAIQIESSGNPWVYYQYGGDIFASRKVNGTWITDQIVSNLFISGITTLDGVGNEIGLFYKGATSEAQTSYGLMFAQWKNNAWETKVLYEQPGDLRDPRPSALQIGNDIYVSFITISGSPDSIIVHVLKENNGNWNEDFSDVVVTQLGGVYISDRGMLGKSGNGNVFLWREYGQSDSGESLGWRLFEKDVNGWHRVNLVSPPDGFMAWPQGSNLTITNNGTIVMISEANGFDPKISWVKPDGTCGLNEKLPYWDWNPFMLWLQDIVTVNDDIYIYYTNGAPGNYDYPVTFKETKININDLITDIKSEQNNIPGTFNLSQNYPNPFNPTTVIEYQIPNVKTQNLASQLVQLKVYNLLGREVAILVNEAKQPGIYKVNFDASSLSSGIYLYELKTGNFTQIRKMILLK